MTALAHWRKGESRFNLPRARTMLFALLAAAIVLVTILAVFPARQPASAAVRVPITTAKTASLMDATSGPAAEQVHAVGAQAKLINASLPFVAGPMHAAQPFAASGTDVEQQRALLCLTRAVYYEAGFEPYQGRRAVAQVVLNRLRHPAFPKSICGVVYQNNGSVCQFSFVCDGSLNRAPAAGAWRQAETVARSALGGYVERSVGSATHYHADYVAPRWAPMLSKVAQLGQHIFYRWPGSWGQPAAFTGRYIGEPRDPMALRVEAPAQAVGVSEHDAVTVTAVAPLVARAPNDVGGLLDTSKGWTLTIPGPQESNSAAAKLVAAQDGKGDHMQARTIATPALASR